MDWLFDNIQIVILIALALASWLKRRHDAKTVEEEERQAREEMAGEEYDFGPVPRRAEPAPAVPPPLVGRHVPPLKETLTTPSPMEPSGDQEAAAILEQQQQIRDRLKSIKAAKAMKPAESVFSRKGSKAKSAAKRPLASTSLRESLRHPSELRRAVILREILGPPVGLK